MLRHLSHRTSQVRDLVFVRDPIYRKDVKTTKDINKDGTRTDSLAGPAVSFGYETNSHAAQNAGVNAAYHVNSPEIVLSGLKALQSPITSRSGQHERTGHRITGECKFYMPSLDYIKSLREFGKTLAFDELETYDKLIDVERTILVCEDETITAERLITPLKELNLPNHTGSPGYEIDRFRTNIKVTTGAVELFKIYGSESSSLDEVSLEWDFRTSAGGSGKITFGDSIYRTVDMPLMIDGRAVVAGDKATVYVDGTAHTAVATATSNDGIMELNKMIGTTNTSEIQQFQVETDNASSVIEIKDTIFYKAAEWRIESITDYRDEYMEARAVRVRGSRTSRRRAYG